MLMLIGKNTRQFLLAIGIFMIISGISSLILPDLTGVDKGITIKINNKKKVTEKYVSPYSDGFVFSDRLPKHVTGAIITSEDEDFYRHNGISLNEIYDAAVYDISHRTLKCGGSTITQQLVKNSFLSNKRTFSRKIVEAITAIRLEKRMNKKQILDYYLNIVEFGDGIYGIRQASKYYFGKSPEKLTPREAAMLAVIMPKPKARGKALEENGSEDFQKRRVARLLYRMKENGYIKS